MGEGEGMLRVPCGCPPGPCVWPVPTQVARRTWSAPGASQPYISLPAQGSGRTVIFFFSAFPAFNSLQFS